MFKSLVQNYTATKLKNQGSEPRKSTAESLLLTTTFFLWAELCHPKIHMLKS